MIKTPINLAMLGDPAAQQFCEMLSLAETFAPLTDGGCGPTGVVLAVDSVRITFPSCVDIVATTGIEVNIGGAGWEAVASVSGGSDRVWEFETTTEIAEGDAVLWQYLGAEDSIVDCVESVDVGVLDPVTVRNTLELTAPTIVSIEVGTVADNVFVFTYSEPVASTDFTLGWIIEAAETELTLEDATVVSPGVVHVITTESVSEGQEVLASYDADVGDIVDVSGYPNGNALASITDEAVTNNVAGGDVTLVSIAVTPDAVTIEDGATQQFTATGTYSDASTADITGDVTWDSSSDAVATITAGGLATGVSYGQVTISATLGAVSGDTTLDIWDPLALFAGSEDGLILKYSDNAAMWQDAYGLTPVTAVGQAVGLVLDTSQELVLGSEIVANGTFNTDLTGWTNGSTGTGTAVVTGGHLVLTGTDTSNRGIVSQAITSSLVTGSWYRFTFDVIATSGSAPQIGIGASIGSGATIGTLFLASAPGSYAYTFYADGGTELLWARTATAAGSVTLDNVSVKKLAGNHARQVTAANKPILAATGTCEWINYDGVDDVLNAVFLASLGTDCTVARAIPGTTPSILTGQTITTTFADSTDNAALVIVNRALTGPETTYITAWLTAKGATS